MLTLHNHIGILIFLIIITNTINLFDDMEPIKIPTQAGFVIFACFESIYWCTFYFFVWN